MRKLRGLEKVCRAIGGMRCGSIEWRWDYANEVAVREEEMPFGGERWIQSERARWAATSVPEGNEKQPVASDNTTF